VRQLLLDQEVSVFEGPFGQLESFAQKGCLFAKHLTEFRPPNGENQDVEFTFQRLSKDQDGLGLISLRKSKSSVQYLALATHPGILYAIPAPYVVAC
jgi:hypothetical protein